MLLEKQSQRGNNEKVINTYVLSPQIYDNRSWKIAWKILLPVSKGIS